MARWSAREDRTFHDELFRSTSYDPFSTAYPGYLTIRRFADLAAEHVRDARTVLDLGCGPGEITCELGRRHPSIRFAGVDHSAVAIERAAATAARLNLSNVTFEAADITAYEPGARAGIVTMFDAFHHLVDPAAFVRRISPHCDRFFLIEPAGDLLGRWRRTLDFDWLPQELEKLRRRIEYLLEETGTAPADRAPASAVAGRAVEHRYPLADYEAFFPGFTVSARGTVAGLDAYPPQPGYDSVWRRTTMDTAYDLLRSIDERLFELDIDLYAKHWAILAERHAMVSPRRPRARAPLPAATAPEEIRGPYDARYERLNVPPSVRPGTQAIGEVTVHNASWRTWRSDASSHPVHLSYRWLDSRRTPVAEGLRTPLPRPLEPGGSCRAALRIVAPPAAGAYLFEFDMVEEGVTWFSAAGIPPLRVPVRVNE